MFHKQLNKLQITISRQLLKSSKDTTIKLQLKKHNAKIQFRMWKNTR